MQSKKVIDYLWEWANEQGDWAKLLTFHVISKESLSEEERDQVYQLFLHKIGAIPESSVSSINVPETIEEYERKEVKLISISEIQGVNRLAPNQELKFSKNLTVIYGNNGSGKTGYSRILKTLGFSYDRNNSILPNVFDSKQVDSRAKVRYSIDNSLHEYMWNGNQSGNVDLSSIGVFNNDCVKLSLDNRRNLIATPVVFHLFNMVSDELEKLQQIHNTEISKRQTALPFLSELTRGTEVYNYIANINTSTSKEEVSALFNFNQDDELELATLQEELQKLNKPLINSQIDLCKKRIAEAYSLITRVGTIKHTLNKEVWENQVQILEKISKLEEEQVQSLGQLAEQKGIELFESVEFQKFIEAAEQYIKKLDKALYPESGDRCIYCLQPLQSDSLLLLQSYKKIMNDTTKVELEKLNSLKSQVVNKISGINTELVINHESFGTDAGSTIIPNYLSSFFEKLRSLINIFCESDSQKLKEVSFDLDFDTVIDNLSIRFKELEDEKTEKENLLSTLSQKEEELVLLINGLRDSKKITNEKETVFKYIDNLKYAALLEEKQAHPQYKKFEY